MKLIKDLWINTHFLNFFNLKLIIIELTSYAVPKKNKIVPAGRIYGLYENRIESDEELLKRSAIYLWKSWI